MPKPKLCQTLQSFRDQSKIFVTNRMPRLDVAELGSAFQVSNDRSRHMSLVILDLPSPASLRGGWAAFSAVCASRGWKDDSYATTDEWRYHDGGGNWACLRFLGDGRGVLVGHDHEYSETYFGEAAEYFNEEETDLLANAPDWWRQNLSGSPFGDWLGFIYGWDGMRWQRASYEKSDGFKMLGLLECCSTNNTDQLAKHAADAPGLNGYAPCPEALAALVNADASVNRHLLESVVPGWDIVAGVAAARKFLEAKL